VELLRFLLSRSSRTTLLIAVAGVFSGLCSAGLIALINRALYAEGSAASVLALGVAALATAKVATGFVSNWMLLKFAHETLLDLSVKLCRRILEVPFRHLERTGPSRMLTALTTDVPVLGGALQIVPSLTVNSAIIVGCGVYLASLYWIGFVALVFVIAAGAAVYGLLHSTAFRAIYLAREQRDHLVDGYRSLADGLKELKLSQPRREEFLARRIEEAAKRYKKHSMVATRKYMYVDAWSQGLFYVLLAGVLLFFPHGSEVLSGYVFAALYMMVPIWAIIGALPAFTNGLASLRKLEELGIILREFPNEAAAVLPALSQRTEVTLSNVVFRYGEGEEEFHIGPIDLAFRPGEIVFIVGGNGSGKTTLLKLIAGLYTPDTGQIRLGDTLITPENLDWYRQHFSVVFFDFHVFDVLFGVFRPDVDDASNRYLAQLELDHKVRVSDRTFSTTALSQGQRKRLALLSALIDERPICVFDEWAADQDPRYKDIFYASLLPELKARGKTVIVITHDDRYFAVGDWVVKLENGQVVADGAAKKRGVA
jgi:putative ATP-binding cassette transporter